MFWIFGLFKMIPSVNQHVWMATVAILACLALSSCSENDPLASLEGEWRPRCGGIAPTGLRITEQDGRRHFTIIGNPSAPVESITEDGNTLSVVAGASYATIIKISPDKIKATYYGSEFVLERCD